MFESFRFHIGRAGAILLAVSALMAMAWVLLNPLDVKEPFTYLYQQGMYHWVRHLGSNFMLCYFVSVLLQKDVVQ